MTDWELPPDAVIALRGALAGYRNEWDAGLGTDPGMWEMLSDYLEEDEVVLTESLNAAIIDLAEGRAFVVRRELPA